MVVDVPVPNACPFDGPFTTIAAPGDDAGTANRTERLRMARQPTARRLRCQPGTRRLACYDERMKAGTRGRRIFSYEEALALFPVVRDLTDAAVRQVEALVNRVQSRDDAETREEEIQASYENIVAAWAAEVVSLGCEVKGLWLVDWDSGDGYYCWRYPEQTVGHFHTYDEGFDGRVPVN